MVAILLACNNRHCNIAGRNTADSAAAAAAAATSGNDKRLIDACCCCFKLAVNNIHVRVPHLRLGDLCSFQLNRWWCKAIAAAAAAAALLLLGCWCRRSPLRLDWRPCPGPTLLLLLLPLLLCPRQTVFRDCTMAVDPHYPVISRSGFDEVVADVPGAGSITSSQQWQQ
jgi:hypothetical protein